MNYFTLFIRLCIDKAQQIKLNFKRDWKSLKREFQKQTTIYKIIILFRKNIVKSLDIVYKIMIVMLTSFITLFIPFQVNVFISEQNIDVYGTILITCVLIALAATLFLLFFL